MKTINEIKKDLVYLSEFVPRISYFEFDGFDEDFYELKNNNDDLFNANDDFDDLLQVKFSTRENGDMSADRHSSLDVTEAQKTVARVKETFPNINWEIEYYDEWVFLYLNFNEKT